MKHFDGKLDLLVILMYKKSIVAALHTLATTAKISLRASEERVFKNSCDINAVFANSRDKNAVCWAVARALG